MSVIVSGRDYLLLPRSPETWLIDGLLPVSGSMLVYGDPKIGKSYAALQLACCLATGSEWLGFGIPSPRKVIYIQLDTPRSLWADRVEKLANAGHPVLDFGYVDRETLKTFPFDILNPEHFKLLAGALIEAQPDVVIIDTIREAHSADENDSTEMQTAIAHLEAAIHPAAMVLIAHARKPNMERGYDLMNDNRGSNYLVGRMDAIVRFSKASLRASSRVLEEASAKLNRLDDGTWQLAEDDFRSQAKTLIDRNPNQPIRELARVLASMSGEREEKCRSLLRRLSQN